MYNNLHFKNNKTGKIDSSISGNLVTEEVAIRFDDYDQEDGDFTRYQQTLCRKEVDRLIEFLQEFKRLLSNAK